MRPSTDSWKQPHSHRPCSSVGFEPPQYLLKARHSKAPAIPCWDGARKAKAHLDFKLARGVKDNKKGFSEHLRNKKKARANVDPLLNGAGALLTKHTKRSECLLCLSLYWYDWPSGIPGPGDQGKSLQKGRLSLGGGRLG